MRFSLALLSVLVIIACSHVVNAADYKALMSYHLDKFQKQKPGSIVVIVYKGSKYKTNVHKLTT